MADADPTDYTEPGWMAVEMLVWDHHVDAAVAALDHFERVAERASATCSSTASSTTSAPAWRPGAATSSPPNGRSAGPSTPPSSPATRRRWRRPGLARILAVDRPPRARPRRARRRSRHPATTCPLLHVARSNGRRGGGDGRGTVGGRRRAPPARLERGGEAGDGRSAGAAVPHDLVEALMRVGRVADAAAAAERIDELAARCGAPTALLHAGRARHAGPGGRGPPRRRRRAGSGAAGAGRGARAPDRPVPGAASARHGAAPVRPSARRARHADRRAGRWRSAMGAVVWRDRIDEELARLGGRRDPYELTSTEARSRRAGRHGAQQQGGRPRAVRQPAHRGVEPDADLPQVGGQVTGRAGRRVPPECGGRSAVAALPPGESRPPLVARLPGPWDRPARCVRKHRAFVEPHLVSRRTSVHVVIIVPGARAGIGENHIGGVAGSQPQAAGRCSSSSSARLTSTPPP